MGYVGVPFPGTVCSSSLYKSFSITPALPEGVSLFTNTGVIQGVPVAVSPATVYTVRATNHLGEAAEATLTLGSLPPGQWRYLTEAEVSALKGSERE